MGARRKKEGERISNIATNPEYTRKFYDEATDLAVYYMNTKFFTLHDYVTPDDVVSECWVKILREGICYDESKSKFRTFCSLLVRNKCYDMFIKYKKYGDNNILCSSDDEEDVMSYIEDSKSEMSFADLEISDLIESLGSVQYDYPVSDIVSLMYAGYTIKDIIKMKELKRKDVNKVMENVKESLEEGYHGNSETLEELLFGDTERDIDAVVSKASLISNSDGTILSDVIELVLDGLSYKQIGDRLGKDKHSVKSFFENCLSIVM